MADVSDKQLVTVGYLNKRLEAVEKTIPEYALHPENLEKLGILNGMDVNSVAFTNKYDSIDAENKPILSEIDERLGELERATIGDDSDIKRYINEELGFKVLDGSPTLTKEFHMGLNTKTLYELGNTTLHSNYTFTLKNKTLVVETENVNFVGDFPYPTLLDEQNAIVGVVEGLSQANQKIDNISKSITDSVLEKVSRLYNGRIASLENGYTELHRDVQNSSDSIVSLWDTLENFKETTETDIAVLKTASERHDSTIGGLSATVSTLSENVVELEENVGRKVTALSNRLQPLENRVIVLEGKVETLEQSVSGLEERTVVLEEYKDICEDVIVGLQQEVTRAFEGINDIYDQLSPENENPIVHERHLENTIEQLSQRLDGIERTDKVEEGSTKLVESGGVWNALEKMRWTEEVSEYEDILIYILDKRRKYEFATLHKVYQWMNRLMAVVLQTYFSQKNGPYVPDFVDDAQLTKEDWRGLREIVDVGHQLLILLARLQLTKKDGTVIEDNPLYEGLEFKQEEITAFKKMLVYKDEIIMLVGRTINKSKQR